MASTANVLDLSNLSAAARREVRDFYQFMLARRGKGIKTPPAKDDAHRFIDLCGGLSWSGDAVAAQRNLRDEW